MWGHSLISPCRCLDFALFLTFSMAYVFKQSRHTKHACFNTRPCMIYRFHISCSLEVRLDKDDGMCANDGIIMMVL